MFIPTRHGLTLNFSEFVKLKDSLLYLEEEFKKLAEANGVQLEKTSFNTEAQAVEESDRKLNEVDATVARWGRYQPYLTKKPTGEGLVNMKAGNRFQKQLKFTKRQDMQQEQQAGHDEWKDYETPYGVN